MKKTPSSKSLGTPGYHAYHQSMGNQNTAGRRCRRRCWFGRRGRRRRGGRTGGGREGAPHTTPARTPFLPRTNRRERRTSSHQPGDTRGSRPDRREEKRVSDQSFSDSIFSPAIDGIFQKISNKLQVIHRNHRNACITADICPTLSKNPPDRYRILSN